MCHYVLHKISDTQTYHPLLHNQETLTGLTSNDFLSLGGIFLSLFRWAGMMNHPPIPISELAEHTELLKANDNLKLSQEYEVSVPEVPSSEFWVMIPDCTGNTRVSCSPRCLDLLQSLFPTLVDGAVVDGA